MSTAVLYLGALTSAQTGQMRPAEVVGVTAEQVFAGRLGKRVNERITVRVNGALIEIRIVGPFHTRASHGVRQLRSGDVLNLSQGDIESRQVRRETLSFDFR